MGFSMQFSMPSFQVKLVSAMKMTFSCSYAFKRLAAFRAQRKLLLY